MKMKNNGFTLLELIIVLAITGIIMSIVVSIFMTGNKVFSDSDTKTTLQMDAKDIQERISDICMQANSIKYAEIDKDTGNIIELVFNWYDGSSPTIKIDNDKLYINEFKVSTKVKSMKIINNNKIIKESSELLNINSINFDIELEGKKVFGNENTYPIKFTVTFRNKK